MLRTCPAVDLLSLSSILINWQVTTGDATQYRLAIAHARRYSKTIGSQTGLREYQPTQSARSSCCWHNTVLKNPSATLTRCATTSGLQEAPGSFSNQEETRIEFSASVGRESVVHSLQPTSNADQRPPPSMLLMVQGSTSWLPCVCCFFMKDLWARSSRGWYWASSNILIQQARCQGSAHWIASSLASYLQR